MTEIIKHKKEAPLAGLTGAGGGPTGLGLGGQLIPAGQQLWNGLSTQSASWTVPANVTAISAVAVGGGGNGSQGISSGGKVHGGTGGNGGNLAYSNEIAVTPGETLTIVIAPQTAAQNSGSDGTNGGDSGIKRSSTWLLCAKGGTGGDASRLNATWNVGNNQATGQGDNVGDVVRIGGLGGCRRYPSGKDENFCGGGGAAGYSGSGGDGGVMINFYPADSVNGANGNGGGGGGGVPSQNKPGSGGGGVGLLGEGTSGDGGETVSGGSFINPLDQPRSVGGAGSGGTDGSYDTGDDGGAGGHYGGGAGGQKNMNRSDWGRGGAGGVRIIHGTGRAYPSTRTADE